MEKFREILGCPKKNSCFSKDWSLPNQKEVDGSFYRVEYLHNVPFFMDECCLLINSEWKRSHQARIKSIKNSCENFPMSLILLENDKKVVGHCKISRLLMSKTKVFVQSVVIHSALRGKGLGKFLMEAVEEVSKRKNMKWIYLTTLGQEIFYEKLGYSECPPVSIFGSQFEEENDNKIEVCTNARTHSVSKSVSDTKVIPPPLPPLPQLANNLPTIKTFMRKEIIF